MFGTHFGMRYGISAGQALSNISNLLSSSTSSWHRQFVLFKKISSMRKKDADKNRQTQSSFVAVAAAAVAAAIGFLFFSECFLYFLLSAVRESAMQAKQDDKIKCQIKKIVTNKEAYSYEHNRNNNRCEWNSIVTRMKMIGIFGRIENA